ncbi:MAG: hypothetical protein JWQ69_409 [Pseudomonas sp.]|nr:hypothetical protein [Pseudomonas sp.]
MSIRIRLLIGMMAGLAVIALPTQAAPAPWYKWQGATRIVCLQTVPTGSALKRIDGPFRDSSCRYPVKLSK